MDKDESDGGRKLYIDSQMGILKRNAMQHVEWLNGIKEFLNESMRIYSPLVSKFVL